MRYKWERGNLVSDFGPINNKTQYSKQNGTPTPQPVLVKSTYPWFKRENWSVAMFLTPEEENLNLPKVGFASVAKILLGSLVSYAHY